MAYCSKCNQDYPDNMKFCHECGSPLEINKPEEKNADAVCAEEKKAKTKHAK